MRGRGIGAARGRATIQRGESKLSLLALGYVLIYSERKKGYDTDEPGCPTIDVPVHAWWLCFV